MASPLVPCPSCARHVRADETACPFCAAALPADLEARAVPASPRRLSRAAAFAFGASLTVAACGSEVTTATGSTGGGGNATTGTGPNDDGGVHTHYGLPAPDASDDGPADDGGGFVLYGPAPPPDAGPDDAAADADAGGGQPIYGTPPPPPPKG